MNLDLILPKTLSEYVYFSIIIIISIISFLSIVILNKLSKNKKEEKLTIIKCYSFLIIVIITSIFLYSCNKNDNLLEIKYAEIMKTNISEDEQIKILSKYKPNSSTNYSYSSLIKYIDEPTERVQLAGVNLNDENIIHIKNPTNNVIKKVLLINKENAKKENINQRYHEPVSITYIRIIKTLEELKNESD